jgi:hypothetical protein
MRFSMYSQTTSTLYLSCAEMGTTGAPSACTAKQHRQSTSKRQVSAAISHLLSYFNCASFRTIGVPSACSEQHRQTVSTLASRCG